jgi:glycerol uptake facilitator-like aquaporin
VSDGTSLSRALAAESVGTALLVAAVVGSGIMGERLAGGNVAIALLANTLATSAALVALILTFSPISGAHFNPAVTVADASQQGVRWKTAGLYSIAQIGGGVLGAGVADTMFGEPVYAWSRHARSGPAQAFSEAVATFGLIAVIHSCSRRRASAVPYAVAAYIGAAYWFTASTSFANPAVTIARALTDTFAGIRPADVPAFIAAQAAGATAATLLFRWLMPPLFDGGQTAMDRVIFACVHNAGRSQIAAGFFNHLADPSRARAVSAGTQPGDRVHPVVVEAMLEVGIDVSGNRPQRLTSDLAGGATLLVTMGCGEECPYVPGVARDDWPLDDPKSRPLSEVRRIRDDIRDRVAKLIHARRWARREDASV